MNIIIRNTHSQRLIGSLKIIERQNIDVLKWNALVSSCADTPFSYSWYLDAVAENWKIIVNDDYSAGMALPYSLRLGVEILYTPIFSRYTEWLGETNEIDAKSIVKNEFKVIEFTTRQPFFEFESNKWDYQAIGKNDELKISNQAERSLKKASSSDLKAKIGIDYSNVQQQIEQELAGKHIGLTHASMPRLYKLFEAAKSEGKILVFEICDDKVRGGIVSIETQNSILYLKGAVDEETKKNGGMYLALQSAIDYARSKGLNFDFGGSRIDGVKKFNHNLGGKDTVYHAYNINNASYWFNTARSLKNKWKK